jgi:hypothetical protein
MKDVCPECGRGYGDRVRMERRINRINRQLLASEMQEDPKKQLPVGRIAHLMAQRIRLQDILNQER